jgi:carboxyl-terminal processing protease
MRGHHLPSIAALLVLVLASCTLVPVAPAPTTAPPVSNSAYPTVQAALNALIERHVDQPSSQTLLEAATTEVRAQVQQRAPSSQLPEPQFSGDAERDFAAFAAILDRAQTEGLTQRELEQTSVNAMARSLNECHTYYLDQERARSFNQPGGQRYGGIGAYISNTQPNTADLPEISRVIRDTPAERAGLRAGDRIKTVDDRDVTGLTSQEVADLIRGPEGTQVRLVIVRAAAEQAFTITRATIVVPTLTTVMEGEFARIELPQIVSNAPEELAAALATLDRAGVRGWILDLRNNPGGDLTSAQNIASAFIQSGVLVHEVGRGGETRPLRVNEKAYYPRPKPLAVLVNRSSASGAEIVASAVQEHKVGRVFGQKTAGCVGIGQPRELPDGGMLLVTVARMQTALSRQDLNGNGVTPDQLVGTNDLSDTAVVEAAVAWLRTQIR